MAEMKKKNVLLKLNSIDTNMPDPTCMRCTFVILDFDKSWNNGVVDKDLALSAAHTLKTKPLVVKYFPVEEPGTETDHLGGHEAYLGQDRHGEMQIKTDTIAIGAAETEGYVTTIKENGVDKEVLACDYMLWSSRYPDVCELIVDWFNRGIEIHSSCEFLYSNYEIKDGVEYIKAPLYFEGHAVLNSEERNGYPVILPAYDSSKLISFNEVDKQKWVKAVAQAANQNKSINSQNEGFDINNTNKQKEVEVMPENNEMFKKFCELSHGDIRSKLLNELAKVMSADEYKYVWISSYDVYDTHFIYENYINDGYVYTKVNYTKTETDVTIDYASKVEVVRDEIWIPKATVDTMQISLNEANVKIGDLEKKIEDLNVSLNTITSEKDTYLTKFNEATDTITALNSEVEVLRPIKETYEQEKFQKALNERTETYQAKFEAVKAKEKFETEEIQGLIKLSLNEDMEGKEALFKLNSMLVDMVQVERSNEKPLVKEFASKSVKLIPQSDDFDSRYSE